MKAIHTKATQMTACCLTPLRCVFLGAVAELFSGCGGAPVERDGFVVEQDAMEDAQTELRRRAAFELKCPEDDLVLTVLGVHDDAGADMPTQVGVDGCGRHATYARHIIDVPTDGPGTRTAMTGWDLESVSSPSSGTESGLPGGTSAGAQAGLTEALGFSFRSTLEEVEAACRDAGHQFGKVGKGYGCSGTPAEVGFDARAHLAFCGDELCRLIVVGDLPQGERGNDIFKNLATAMREKYGDPAENDMRFPSDCRVELVSCVAQKRASWDARWNLPAQAHVEVSIAGKNGRAHFKVKYSVQRRGEPIGREGEASPNVSSF